MPREDYDNLEEDDLEEEEEPEFDAVEDEDDREEEVETEDDVADLFDEAQNLDYGRGDLTRKLRSHTDKSPALSGGDIDADWDHADVGEETVGGQNPTPDQSDVDELGEAMGIVYQDNEPVNTDDKLERRDKNPWELNPASAGSGFGARGGQGFQQPLRHVTGRGQRKRTSPSASAEKSARAAATGATGTSAGRNTRNAATSRRGGKSKSGSTGGRATLHKNAGTFGRRARTTRRRSTSTRRTAKTRRAAGNRAADRRRGGKRM